MAKELLEREYYPKVEAWLKKEFKCFKAGINLGPVNSRADVVGIRDVGGDFSGEIEVIIVEVKRAKEAFATASGQTYGYKVYANRVYLADKRIVGFTEEEIMIANHLGIGLIQIDKNNRCREVLSSPYHKPLTKLHAQLLRRMDLAKCQFCETYFEVGNENGRTANVTRTKIKKAIQEDKGIVFWHRELDARKSNFKSSKRQKDLTYEKRYLCPECTHLIFSDRQ